MRKKATNLEGKGLSIPVTLLISSPKTLLSFINAKIFLAGKNPRFMKAKPQLFELFEGIPAKKINEFDFRQKKNSLKRFFSPLATFVHPQTTGCTVHTEEHPGRQ